MVLRSCLVLGLLLGCGLDSTADTLYSVTDLGTLGGRYSEAFGINNAGQITGLSYTSSGATHAFLYSNGQMQDLGTLGGLDSEGLGINDAGQVTGSSDTSGITHGHAFVYVNGQMKDLGMPGGPDSVGFGINNAGQVTGNTGTPLGPTHAFLYSNGQLTDLDPLGSRNSTGWSINNAGQIAGSAQVPPFGDTHLFIYDKGQITDVPGGDLVPTSINNAGQVVGNVGHPFLYNDGQLYNLNDLIDPSLHLRFDELRRSTITARLWLTRCLCVWKIRA